MAKGIPKLYKICDVIYGRPLTLIAEVVDLRRAASRGWA